VCGQKGNEFVVALWMPPSIDRTKPGIVVHVGTRAVASVSGGIVCLGKLTGSSHDYLWNPLPRSYGAPMGERVG
jgi:hypothetical protein